MQFTLLSPSIPFPSIDWWAAAMRASLVVVDAEAPFRKMADRNRYRIATAAGALQLTIPIEGGRNQRNPINKIRIWQREAWQQQHCRTIYSAYGKAPYFEHYSSVLESLFHRPFTYLWEFNDATLRWLWQELKPSARLTNDLDKLRGDVVDICGQLPGAYGQYLPDTFSYHQVFEDRHGFLSHLSVLDMLMNEGPLAGGMLMESSGQ